MRRRRWHRCRWYTIAVEHLAPAPGQDPPHGWTIVKRACVADWCAELAASVMPGTWSPAEARGIMPWNGTAAPVEEAARRGGLGAIARERAAAADPYAVPGLPGPVMPGESWDACLGDPAACLATAAAPASSASSSGPDGGPPWPDAQPPARPSWAWREPGEP